MLSQQIFLLAALGPLACSRRTTILDKIPQGHPPKPWTERRPVCYATTKLTEGEICNERINGKKSPFGYTAKIVRSLRIMDTSKMEVPEVTSLGFFQTRGPGKYEVELKETKSRSDRVLDAMLGVGKSATQDLLGLVIPGAGTFVELVTHIMKLSFSGKNIENPKLDLTKYFEHFDKYLNRKDFGNLLNEIQRKYDVFSQWLEELADPELGPTEIKFRERKVFMIESQIDLARVYFMQTKVDSGLAAYYLFEPFLQQALLHQSVMFMHVGILKVLGEDQEALVHFHRAKVRYNEYRLRLSDMQKKLLKWRTGRITVANTSFLELKESRSRLARKLCKVKWTTNDHYDYRKDTLSVEYAWKDEQTGYQRSQHFRIVRKSGNKLFDSEHSCTWKGAWSDGRDMLKEPDAYIELLSAELLRHTNELLAMLDVAWLKMPGPDCLDDFELRVVEDVSKFKCHSTTDEALSRRLKERFGALRQDGFWPGQQPVINATRYLICTQGGDPFVPVHYGNVCVKF